MPLWVDLNNEVGYSYVALNNSYALCCAGLSVGCVLLIPVALKYGRRPVYVLSAICFTGFSVWMAKWRTMADLYASSTLIGVAAAVNEALFQVTV